MFLSRWNISFPVCSVQVPPYLLDKREGWKFSSCFAHTALNWRSMHLWSTGKALSESGLLHIFLRARSVLNCRTGFREELHLLCQSSPSWCSCMEEAMSQAERILLGGKHCSFSADTGRGSEGNSEMWQVGWQGSAWAWFASGFYIPVQSRAFTARVGGD